MENPAVRGPIEATAASMSARSASRMIPAEVSSGRWDLALSISSFRQAQTGGTSHGWLPLLDYLSAAVEAI